VFRQYAPTKRVHEVANSFVAGAIFGLGMGLNGGLTAILLPLVWKLPVFRNPRSRQLASRKALFAGISRVWWSSISDLCAETSPSGPFWRASLRRQKSRSKPEEGGLARRSSG